MLAVAVWGCVLCRFVKGRGYCFTACREDTETGFLAVYRHLPIGGHSFT